MHKNIKFSQVKIFLQKIAILMIVLSGIAHIAISIQLQIEPLRMLKNYYGWMSHNEFQIHKTFSIIAGYVLLILSRKLSRKIRIAWIMSLCLLSVSAFFYTLQFKTVLNPMTLCELFIIVVLAASHNDFCRKADRVTVRFATGLLVVSLLLVVLNGAVGFFVLKNNYRSIVYFWDSMLVSVQMFFFMDPSVSLPVTHLGNLYADYVVTLDWICLLLGLLFLLKPLVYHPIVSELDRKRVHELVRHYGQNPIAYLALEHDKKYFFGSNTQGVVAYTVVADTAVCCGDIICPPEEESLFLAEFMLFCRQNGLGIVMLNVTEKYLPIYRSAHFGCVKYGEDAVFDLSQYDLKGGKIASVRAAINHANKNGITVFEYKPHEGRDPDLERAVMDISNLWMQSKKSSELQFMFGSIGFEDPGERRYFMARATDGRLLGFVVFNPFDSGRGYLAEVTRRLPDAPPGVMEKIIYEAFMHMKSEGILWGSLGTVPLANVRENDETLIAGRLFDFIYENLNAIYGFKSLHHAKKKFAPTHWQQRYLVYHPHIFNAKIAYTIVKVQNPKGISDYVLTLLRKQPES